MGTTSNNNLSWLILLLTFCSSFGTNFGIHFEPQNWFKIRRRSASRRFDQSILGFRGESSLPIPPPLLPQPRRSSGLTELSRNPEDLLGQLSPTQKIFWVNRVLTMTPLTQKIFWVRRNIHTTQTIFWIMRPLTHLTQKIFWVTCNKQSLLTMTHNPDYLLGYASTVSSDPEDHLGYA